jgi:(p)ppGpp synthase/HD superfamily hydrolase
MTHSLGLVATQAIAAFHRIHNGAGLTKLDPNAPLIVYRAFCYAEHLHALQKRKGPSKRPYLHHLLMVWQLVALAGGSVSQQVAALLHDAVEDAQKTWPSLSRAQVRSEIEARFGAVVLSLVDALTNPDTLDGLAEPLKTRTKKDYQRQQLAQRPDIRVVKAADKLANIYDSLVDTPDGWSEAKIRAELTFAKDILDTYPELPAFYRELYQGYVAMADAKYAESA